MSKPAIDAEEFKILAVISLFSIVWMMFIVPYLTSDPSFNSFNPILQYVLFNAGMILLVVVVFGTIFSFVLKHEYDLMHVLINGLAAWLSFSFIADMYAAPFAIDKLGNQIITGNATGVNSSVDMMWVYIFNTILPSLKGMVIPIVDISALYLAVYVAVPILTSLIAAYILSDGQFFKWFNFGGIANSRRQS